MVHQKFRYLSHTADVEFMAFGRNLHEAMENAGLALLNVALDLKRIKKDNGIEKSISIREKADSIENLVWFTLQDIISKRNADYLNAYSFKIEELKTGEKGNSLKGRLLYKEMDGDYSLLDVKAVTPHDLKIARNRKTCSIRITLDV